MQEQMEDRTVWCQNIDYVALQQLFVVSAILDIENFLFGEDLFLAADVSLIKLIDISFSGFAVGVSLHLNQQRLPSLFCNIINETVEVNTTEF